MRFKVKNYTIPAGSNKPIMFPSRFFFLLESESAVDITFVKNHSAVGEVDEVLQGFSHGPTSDLFDGVKISSTDGSAQTVKVCMGTDPTDYRRIVGSVVLTGGSIATVGSITDPVAVSGITPLSLDGYSYFGVTSATTAVGTLVTPAANVNGVEIASISLLQTGGSVRLSKKTTAVAGWFDGEVLAMWEHTSANGRHGQSDIVLPHIVPAGYGLYESSNTAATSHNTHVNFKVL